GGHTRLPPVAAELAAHDIGRVERPDCLEQPPALVAPGLVVLPGRAFLGETGDYFEHVVLHHVADRPRLFVEFATAGHAEALGHRDLHALDVLVIPAGFAQRVGEAEVDEVL